MLKEGSQENMIFRDAIRSTLCAVFSILIRVFQPQFWDVYGIVGLSPPSMHSAVKEI